MIDRFISDRDPAIASECPSEFPYSDENPGGDRPFRDLLSVAHQDAALSCSKRSSSDAKVSGFSSCRTVGRAPNNEIRQPSRM